MDIHRSRFVPYPPSAINAIAFSHQGPENDIEDPECLRLAIGRANGNIEIWNPGQGSWRQERVFSGGKDRSVEGLAWIQEPLGQDENGTPVAGRLRLFSIGYSHSITEWNLATGLPERHSDGNYSEVWCFATQPKSQNSQDTGSDTPSGEQQDLVAGCADGTLVLISTADNELRFERFLYRSSTKKARALSITYKDRNTVLAGYADSTIRVFDTRSRSLLRNISLGTGPPGGPKEILVWKVRCLSNGDFVTGDSTGDVRIYDGKNYSQVQRISGHDADILDIAVSRDGTKIFSAGMDRRTCLYTCSKRSGAARGNRGEKWRKVSHQRYHDHDVKALAAFEGNKLNVIVSGGIDAKPVVVPLRQFGKELSRGLAALPRVIPLASAPSARLMVSWWNCELRIWRVKNQTEGSEKPKVVARVALQGDENITSVSITHDGDLLAVATVGEVKMFQLSQPKPGSGSALRIRKLAMPTKIGAQLVRFSRDRKWLAFVTSLNSIHLARIVRSDDGARPRILSQLLCLNRLQRPDIALDALNGPRGSYDRSIIHAEFSTDSTIFAVADIAGYVDTWVVEGHEDSTAPDIDIDESSSAPSADGDDSDEEEEAHQQRVTVFGQRWIRNPSGHLLPRLDFTPLLISFQPGPDSTHPEPNGNPAVHPTRHNPHPHSRDLPTTEQNLFVVSAEHQMYQFEVLGGRLSDWSRRNPPSKYPAQFRMLEDPAKGCVWDVADARQRVWLYGERWLFMFDLAKDLPPVGPSALQLTNSGEEKGPGNSKKRVRDSKDAAKKMNSGAGDAVPEGETPVTKMRKFNSGKSDDAVKSVWIDANHIRHAALNEEDVEDEDDMWAGLGRGANEDDDVSKEEVIKDADQQEQKKKDSWWHTLKYRPILGIVPVGGDEEPLEVVLVERPSWDLELPPRFVGSHE